eukprot:CAMPEP_0202709030 /NCGR_PEP_ID=MMETSP1385-20130828/21168_1 /ASSEMBLY_ACC=CAM_ASM_000861 /TAXON_ID=933848 /ORGANISM="Elphidium margaritaceum" /LENGTH=451 /DNA_ID=CAMNT_0049368173 /DNA_START=52 /DNA_END=1407 /DNA_ORIENTATION=+
MTEADERNQWRVGSKCEVYSNSDQRWHKAIIFKVTPSKFKTCTELQVKQTSDGQAFDPSQKCIVAFLGHYNKHVSAFKNGSIELKAENIGENETFVTVPRSKDGSKIGIKMLSSDLYLGTDKNGKMWLKPHLKEWEEWIVEKDASGRFAFKAVRFNKYLCGQPNGKLVADRAKKDAWENWRMVMVGKTKQYDLIEVNYKRAGRDVVYEKELQRFDKGLRPESCISLSGLSLKTRDSESLRKEWKRGSKCEVYSTSKNAWYPAIITKTLGVHLEVEYNNGYQKNLQRNDPHVRPSTKSRRLDDDEKAVSLVQYKQTINAVRQTNVGTLNVSTVNVYANVNSNNTVALSNAKKVVAVEKKKKRTTAQDREALAKELLSKPYQGHKLVFKEDGTVDKRCKAFKQMVNDGYLAFDTKKNVRSSCQGYQRWTAILRRSLEHVNGVRFTYNIDGSRK